MPTSDPQLRSVQLNTESKHLPHTTTCSGMLHPLSTQMAVALKKKMVHMLLVQESAGQTVLLTRPMYSHMGLDPPTPSTEQNCVPYITQSIKHAALIETKQLPQTPCHALSETAGEID
jgi:hypothetical protein